MDRLEYFYLIRHKASNKFYAGSKYSKRHFIHPDQFWNENWNGPGKAYFSTSNKVKKICSEEGSDAFEVCFISHRPNNDAREFEAAFLKCIDAANCTDWINGHNGCSKLFNPIGHTHSIETKNKIRMSHLGKAKSKSHKENISKGKRGKSISPQSESSKKAKSDAMRGRCFSDEHKAKLKLAASNRKTTKLL